MISHSKIIKLSYYDKKSSNQDKYYPVGSFITKTRIIAKTESGISVNENKKII